MDRTWQFSKEDVQMANAKENGGFINCIFIVPAYDVPTVLLYQSLPCWNLRGWVSSLVFPAAV